MMRFMTLLMLLACIAATGQLYALTADDDRDAATVQQAEPAQGKPPAGTTPQQSAKPKDTFKPSERIGADSAVSFPVDI
jgi:hypothetical protein